MFSLLLIALPSLILELHRICGVTGSKNPTWFFDWLMMMKFRRDTDLDGLQITAELDTPLFLSFPNMSSSSKPIQLYGYGGFSSVMPSFGGTSF